MKNKYILYLVLFFAAFSISCGEPPRPVLTSSSGVKTYPGNKIVQSNGKKTKEIDVILQFTDNTMRIKGVKKDNIRYEIPYDYITMLKYKQTKHLRDKGSSLYVPLPHVPTKPTVRRYIKKHWLSITYITQEDQEKCLKLRLNEKYYLKILSALGLRTGLSIERDEVE